MVFYARGLMAMLVVGIACTAQSQTTILRWGDVVGGGRPQVQMIDRVAASEGEDRWSRRDPGLRWRPRLVARATLLRVANGRSSW